MSLLMLKDIAAGYEGHTVLTGVSFNVDAGEYMCVIGENGAGKSTLMRVLAGLQLPLAGSFTLGEGLRREDIGYLPQQTAVQKDFPASVYEIVLSGRQGRRGLKPFYSAEDKRRACACMEKMGISGLASRCYRELSGGQQQKVLLARALCVGGRVLLLDEPVTGLDPNAARDMYETLEKLHADGASIVMITHDAAAAPIYADSILRVGGGTAVKEANVRGR